VPELPEVDAVRRRLAPVMTGARFTRVVLHRADLRQPFPRKFVTRLVGQRVVALERRGKYLLGQLSSGETLIMHLGMSGSFRIQRRATRAKTSTNVDRVDRHDHVVFEMSSGATITFNDPRRFGLMDLLSPDRLSAHAALGPMGPEPLSKGFTADVLAARCRGKRVALKVALLDQAVVAGLGNIYASEALHVARLSPFRKASTIATAAGQPVERTRRLAAAIVTVLKKALARKRRGGTAEFLVYEREAERCDTPGCRGTIRRVWQAGRSTFYCPVCQK